MDTNNLRYFAAVAKYGSITQAAKAAYITQHQLSHIIRQLEKEIDVYKRQPYIPDSRFQRLGVEKCETLDDLLKEADVITIHTPKTEETVNMLGAAEWKKCKKGVRVVNCARGGLYNEQDLAEAVKEGIVASVGLDVVVDEPNPISPLIGMPQCVVTPHLGASTFEAQDKVCLLYTSDTGPTRRR